jgi:hypothetical protein
MFCLKHNSKKISSDIFFFFVVVVIIFVGREFCCWFFKQNKIGYQVQRILEIVDFKENM